MKKGVTGEDMCVREQETEREATRIYRIQRTDVPESERARKRENIGL